MILFAVLSVAVRTRTTNFYFWLDINWKCLLVANNYFRYAANFYLETEIGNVYVLVGVRTRSLPLSCQSHVQPFI